MSDMDFFMDLLSKDVPPVTLGNSNSSGDCGMCGVSVPVLYPCKVGNVDFMICPNCKAIMDM